MDTNTTLLCQTSTGQEDDWKNVYESSFPADERMAVEDIRQLLNKGQMKLHKTLNKQGELLCFSLIFPVTDFTLLSYIASNPAVRSGGYGSKHMKRLIEMLKSENPKHIGLFLEIESTKEKGLDPEVLKMRNRRLDFYQRLGAKRLTKEYLCPNLSQPGGTPRPAELLWVDFGVTTIDEDVLGRVVKEIYERAYLLACEDSLVQQIVSQFKVNPCKPKAAPVPTSGEGSTGSTGTTSADPAPSPTNPDPAKAPATPAAPEAPAAPAAPTPTEAPATPAAPAAPTPTEAPATPDPTPTSAGDTNGGAPHA